jgi:translation initiation factor 3 subunit I
MCLHTWEFPTAVKRVEFSEDGSMLLAVTEQRMGHVGTVVVFPINEDGPRISTPAPVFCRTKLTLW